MKPEQRRFLIRFGVALVVLYLLVAIKPSNDHVVVPFTEGIVAVSAALLRALGEPVVKAGTVLRTASFAVDVKNGCNGLEAVIILAAAVVAFPATLRQRLIGLAAGFIVIEVLNLVRVVSLYWLGVHRPAIFELFHAAVWQTALILVAVGLFVSWSRGIAKATAGRS
jgi:exosortase H (IPTLxxWG-CTERM-specific)